MASPAPAPSGWTYQRYLELDDDQRYEILDGELALEDREYRLVSFAAESGAVASRLLAGFAVAVADVMAG